MSASRGGYLLWEWLKGSARNFAIGDIVAFLFSFFYVFAYITSLSIFAPASAMLWATASALRLAVALIHACSFPPLASCCGDYRFHL
jgi:hypothetical protein